MRVMTRKGPMRPSDYHHVVKVYPETFERLGDAAMSREMSRPKLAMELLNFMLDNPDIIDTLLIDGYQAEVAE